MLQNSLATIVNLLNSVIPVLIALGLVYFVWGVVQYVIADAEEAKKSGKDRIIYGIIGLAVITSLWGLVNIVIKTFGLGNASAPSLAPGVCEELTGNPSIGGLFSYVTCLIGRSVIPLIFALALATFVWGVVKFFIIDVNEEAKRSQGKQFMIWGIIALTVMVSVWSLVRILGTTFNIPIGVPQTSEQIGVKKGP